MVRISLNAGLVMNMVIMHLNVLREKWSLKVDSNLEDLEIDYANEEEDEEEYNQRKSEYHLGFLAIKEDDLDSEIGEESALISQVEKKD